MARRILKVQGEEVVSWSHSIQKIEQNWQFVSIRPRKFTETVLLVSPLCPMLSIRRLPHYLKNCFSYLILVSIEHLSSQSRCEIPDSLHFIYLLWIGFNKNVSLSLIVYFLYYLTRKTFFTANERQRSNFLR